MMATPNKFVCTAIDSALMNNKYFVHDNQEGITPDS